MENFLSGNFTRPLLRLVPKVDEKGRRYLEVVNKQEWRIGGWPWDEIGHGDVDRAVAWIRDHDCIRSACIHYGTHTTFIK